MKNYIIIYDTDNGQKETHCTAEQLERVKKIINDFFGVNSINTIAQEQTKEDTRK